MLQTTELPPLGRTKAKPAAPKPSAAPAADASAAASQLVPAAGADSLEARLAQLPEALSRLSSRPVVVRRRYRWRDPDQSMIGSVGRGEIARAAAGQLHVELPAGLIMLDAPITDYGRFTVPLNLAGPDGAQAEVSVEVLKVRWMR